MTTTAANSIAKSAAPMACPCCQCHRVKQIADLQRPDRMERFRQFDERKYSGLLSTWLPELPVQVLQCQGCGHAFYSHHPTAGQLKQMYANARRFFPGERPAVPTNLMMLQMTKVRALVPAKVKTPTLLDYGSGFGNWARAAVRCGFTVTAFEPSEERSASEQSEFELVNDIAALGIRHFDVIQLEQVLEHVTDPLATLRLVRRFCADGTVVRVSVPNILRAPEGNLIWQTWPYDGHAPHTLAPFEHLHGFTPKSLMSLLRRAGFRSFSPIATWRIYPLNQLRQLFGSMLPRVGTTTLLVRRS